MKLPIVLLAFCLIPVAHSQEVRNFSYRTICLDYENQVKKLYLAESADGARVEVPLFTEDYSPLATGRTIGAKVTFFLTSELPTPEKIPPALQAVTLPQSSRILFLFIPNPGKKDEPYHVIAMADDTVSFPLGSVKILNLTAAQLRFDLGEHAGPKGIAVAPGKTASVKSVSTVNDWNQYDAKALYEVNPGVFAPFYNTRWRSIATKRDFAVAYLDPKSKEPTVMRYEDVSPALEKENKGP
jgi:hypothetical protein